MQSFITTILVAILAAVFSALTTYFIRSVSEKRTLDNLTIALKTNIDNSIKHHEEVYHRDEVVAIVKEGIREHERHCIAPRKLEIIFNKLECHNTALAFLVSKNGGNPKELGL